MNERGGGELLERGLKSDITIRLRECLFGTANAVEQTILHCGGKAGVHFGEGGIDQLIRSIIKKPLHQEYSPGCGEGWPKRRKFSNNLGTITARRKANPQHMLRDKDSTKLKPTQQAKMP